MPRRPRRETDCRLHHITTRGNNRRSMFEDADDRERFYDLLHVGLAAHNLECHQDVQMGNHVHLLLGGRDHRRLDADVVREPPVRARLQPAPRRINHLLGRRFHSSERARRARRPRRLRLHRDEPGARRALRAPRRLAVRLVPATRSAEAVPRPHLEPDLTRDALRRPRDPLRGRDRGARSPANSGGTATTRGDPPAARPAHAGARPARPPGLRLHRAARSPRTTGARPAPIPAMAR